MLCWKEKQIIFSGILRKSKTSFWRLYSTISEWVNFLLQSLVFMVCIYHNLSELLKCKDHLYTQWFSRKISNAMTSRGNHNINLSFWKYQCLLTVPTDRPNMEFYLKQLDKAKFYIFRISVSTDVASSSLKAMFVVAVEDILHSLNKHFIDHCIWKRLWITTIFAEVELIAQRRKTLKYHLSSP